MQMELGINLKERIDLRLKEDLFFQDLKISVGRLRQLALKAGSYSFSKIGVTKNDFEMAHDSSYAFMASDKKDAKANLEGRGHEYSFKSWLKIPDRAEIKGHFQAANLTARNDQGEGLRNAQLGAVHSLLSFWSLSRKPATVVLPTGTGKTETMLATVIVDQAERTLVIVPTIDLREQISWKFIEWGLLRRLGIISSNSLNPVVLTLEHALENEGDVSYLESANVVVTTPWLLANAPLPILEKIKNIFSHVFFDEAHHVKALTWSRLKILFSTAKIVQFTATPYRGDRQPIEGKVVYNYPLENALNDECFSRISLVSVDEPNPVKKDKAIADAAVAQLVKDRKAGYSRHKIMVRARNIPHAEELEKSYREWFPKERVLLIYSKTKSKNELIREIRDGKHTIVVCVEMLKEGFDFPDFKIAAVHGLHKSLAVLLQFIGRFTRPEKGLGDASFIVNFSEEEIPQELENLFREGSGWEKVIAQEADRRKDEAESLLNFLQGCEPFSGFDSPDIEMNPKLVYPALSCGLFRCDSVRWDHFMKGFNRRRYMLSQPYYNKDNEIFYFSTQRRDKVKWAKTKEIRDQIWDLLLFHYDKIGKILYLGYTEKNLDLEEIIQAITGNSPNQIKKDSVFRSFDQIKRLKIIHAGVFKPANRLNRYSRLSGADVTSELSKLAAGGKSKKSDFVGIGFRNGEPVGIGASVKGKIWSPARVGNVKDWKEWCLGIGKLVLDEKIDTNKVFNDSAKVIDLVKFPPDMPVLAVDWSEDLYDKIHKLEIGKKGESIRWIISECSLKLLALNAVDAQLRLMLPDGAGVDFTLGLGGEDGHSISVPTDCSYEVEGLKSDPLDLQQFFQDHPPTFFLLDGNTISGCIHTIYRGANNIQIPSNRMEALIWEGVDLKFESMYSSRSKGKPRADSIQEYMMNLLKSQGAKIVFNDDNSGEVADVIGVFLEGDTVRFSMVHCKYSLNPAGARVSDLYEVCGQAIKSLRHKWDPEGLLKHMDRRDSQGVLKGKRFFHGSRVHLGEIKLAMRYCDVVFEFAIAQPGVKLSEISASMMDVLASTYASILDMTEVKLRCYFS